MENGTLHIVASYFDKTVKEYMFKVDTSVENLSDMLSQPEIFTLPAVYIYFLTFLFSSYYYCFVIVIIRMRIMKNVSPPI